MLHFEEKFILSEEKLNLSEQNSLLRAKNVFQCLLLSIHTHNSSPSRSVFAFALARNVLLALSTFLPVRAQLFLYTVIFVPQNQPITDLDAKKSDWLFWSPISSKWRNAISQNPFRPKLKRGSGGGTQSGGVWNITLSGSQNKLLRYFHARMVLCKLQISARFIKTSHICKSALTFSEMPVTH